MIKNLLAYQEIDAKLKAIETELAGSEERKKALSAKKYLDGVEESVYKLDVRAQELNTAYQVALAEQEKLKEQEADFAKTLESVEDETEAEYLLKKASELLGKIKNLNAETTKIANEIQSVLAEYAKIRATTKSAQAQYSEYGKKYNELKASKQEEKSQIEAQLLELKKSVDPTLMEKYLKKRSDKIYPILFEVKGEVCGACNMQLPMSELSKLKNGEIIECDQCRRLLFKSK